MRRLRLTVPVPGRFGMFLLGLCACLQLNSAMAAAVPAPTNDNFAAAIVLTGGSGTVTNTSKGATAEAGEPSHAGNPASASVWYKWTAPRDGELSLDTINSSFNTVLAVYVGSDVSHLTQVAANDNLFPAFLRPVPIISGDQRPYQLPYFGPSGLRFNASAGTTYYIAVDGVSKASGTYSLAWAYHPSGVFRFASEDIDKTTYGRTNATGLPLFEVSDSETFSGGDETTIATYYPYDVPGALVAVTRVAGSVGRVLVDYQTFDISAVGGTDYIPVSGTLAFDDFEMTKYIFIAVFPSGLPGPPPVIPDPTFAAEQDPYMFKDIGIALSNPRPDPSESPEVSAPRTDDKFGTAIVRIWNTDVDPFFPGNLASDTNDPPVTYFVGPSNAVFNFEKSHYRVPEDVMDFWKHDVIIRVVRSRMATNHEGVTLNYRVLNYLGNNLDANELMNNEFPLQPESDYATPDPATVGGIQGTNSDFTMTQGTISFGADDFIPKEIHLTITNDVFTEFNEDIHVFLYKEVNGIPVTVGTINEACITILYDDQDPPAGSVDELHNADFGLDMTPPVLTSPQQLAHPGTDGIVYSLVVQPDGKTILAGNFVSYNTIPRNGIVRTDAAGLIDPAFDPGSGPNDFISSVSLLSDGRLFVGGGFTSFNGAQRNSVTLLFPNGALDNSFDPQAGANAPVWATAVQPSDGKLLIAGEFTSYNGVTRMHIARLNLDGSLDTSFDPGLNGPDGTVWTIALQTDGRILLGGEFVTIGGNVRGGLARLNADGSVDTSFNPGAGTDGTVFALNYRQDGRIWVGGEFTRVGTSLINRFARLNNNGSVDTTFSPGIGADDTVYSIVSQSDGKVYVGGRFINFNGTRRAGFTRLFADGTVDTGFLDTAYNQFAGLHRVRFSDPAGIVFTSSVLPDGKVMIGGSFTQVGGGQANINIRYDAAIPEATNNLWIEPKARDGLRNRSNVARLIGGSTPGSGNISLLYNTYSVNRDQSFLYVSLMRTNGYLGTLSANFSVLPGLAQPGTDFSYNNLPPIYETVWPADRMRSDGLFGTNGLPFDSFGFIYNYVQQGSVVVSLLSNSSRGNKNSTFQLANPTLQDIFYLGGANVPLAGALGRSQAPFTIIDDDHRSGVLSFASTTYSVSENGTNAVITVVRTNGSYGSVSVSYSTTNGTGIAGVDYQASSGVLTFGNGQTNRSFIVPVINNTSIQPTDRTVTLRLSTPGGGASLGLSNAVLSIIDDDFPLGYINFSQATYVTNETSLAVTLTVNRVGGNRGAVSVQFNTTNQTAIDGENYLGVSKLLRWNDGDATPRFITVPLIADGLVGPSTTFKAVLSNPVGFGTNAPTMLAGSRPSAVVTIIDDDSYGTLGFSSPTYNASENGGYATLTVVRTGGSAQSVSVDYATSDGTAVGAGPSPNYVSVRGTLTFGPGEVAKSFNVPLIDDGVVDPYAQFFFTAKLSNPNPAGILATQTVATVNILDVQAYNEPAGSPDTTFNPLPGFNGDIYCLALQPDGGIVAGGDFTVVDASSRNRIVRMNADGSLDNTFLSNLSGANGAVRAVTIQSNGRVLISGSFTSVNGVNRNRIARLQSNGLLDTSFNPGAAADNSVFAVAESFVGPNRELLVGGSFNTFNGYQSPGLIRLNDDGSRDVSFNPSMIVNGVVYAIAVYPTNTIQGGKILIAGDFTSINGIGRNGIARLNQDGTVDTNFDPGTGATNTVWAVAIQLDGKVLLGGTFTNFNGHALNHVARLNVDGTLDANFNIGLGTDDTVDAIAIQADNRIVLAGQFTRASGVSRGRITRLLPDGSVDPFINFGLGADGFVNGVGIQSDGMIVIGGGFSSYDGQARSHLARIYGGALAGSGAFEFTSGDFAADENSTNTVVTVRRRGGTEGPVSIDFSTSDGTAVAGINYSNVSATLNFPNGETLQSVVIPLRDDLRITEDLQANLLLANPLPAGGPGLGSQPSASLTVINDDSSVSFSSPTYSRNEDAIDGRATVHVQRRGSTRGTATVQFMTTTNGTAFANTNYVGVTNILTFPPGVADVAAYVPLIHNPAAEGNKTTVLELTNASNTLLFAPYLATLTIIDVDRAAGNLLFTSTNYVVSESAGVVPVTVLRTNGVTGLITVQFNTIPGTAAAGTKYIATNGVLTFLDGETVKTIYVPILQDSVATGNQTFTVALSSPSGGASLGIPASTTVTIFDTHVGVGFTSPIYAGLETGGSVTLGVQRVGTNGSTSVSYYTTNGTAISGTNYTSASGTLTFNPGEALKTFIVPVLHDPRVTGDLSFGVNLRNLSEGAQILPPGSATVVVLDTDPGFSFTNANFYGVKSGTNVVVSVVRSNANSGLVTVNYATTNGTGVAGVDYVSTSGLLTFSNGIALQSFSIPLINNRLAQGDRTFSVGLFNPSGGSQLLAPYTASITVTDNIAGLSFSSPSYSVSENGGLATITVLRTGFTNSLVTVAYSTADGTAKAQANYTPVEGVFTFTNGDTVKTFSVPIIDDSLLNGDKTVLLKLSIPVGNAVLVNPNAAVLTIVEADGSLILPAGSALTSESGPTNGVVDPGETVSVLLALRNGTGTNTADLQATLLATNGVTNPSGPQDYGVLTVHGPSVSRPFTFTAHGTNGQIITATLLLRDGVQTNLAVFNFALGSATTAYSNSAPIVIRDYTNALPYPSRITVNGLAGLVNKATVTITNLNHTGPSDIDALLVSPTGQKSLLMAKAGGNFAVQRTTLTFDDAAPTYLPSGGQIVSGTNRPTSYAVAPPPFPLPAPPPPYSTGLSVFSNGNANGDWSLFILDDKFLDSGTISNGWSLNLTVSGPVTGAGDLGVSTAVSSPSVIVTSNFTYVIAVTNYGPSPSTNVVVTNSLPSASLFVSAVPTRGSVVTNGLGQAIWTVGNLAKDTGAKMTLTIQPTVIGDMTNTVTASASTSDLNPDEDTSVVVTTVYAPLADLVLSLLSIPNQVMPGDTVTYAMSVANLGPAIATHVSLTNALPPGCVFVSASPATYTVAGNIVTFTNLGDLASGGQVSASVVVQTTLGGILTDIASCSSAISDPLKGNNLASVKTEVGVVLLTFAHSGSNLTLSWPASAAGAYLESSQSVGPLAVWTPVTNPPPVNSGGVMTVTVPIGNGTSFFRLHVR